VGARQLPLIKSNVLISYSIPDSFSPELAGFLVSGNWHFVLPLSAFIANYFYGHKSKQA